MSKRKPPRKRPSRRPDDTPDQRVVWINSELLPDGSYRPAIAFTDDRSVVLDESTAVRYALAVLDAARRADYDAAVLAQMTDRLQRRAGLTLRRAPRPQILRDHRRGHVLVDVRDGTCAARIRSPP